MPDAKEADRLFEEGDDLSTKGAAEIREGRTEKGHEWFRKAIASYEAALAQAPPDDLLLVSNLKLCVGGRRGEMGEADVALGLYREVIENLEAGADLAPGGEAADLHAIARLNIADLHRRAGEIARARGIVEEVLADAPEHPYGLFLRDECRKADD